MDLSQQAAHLSFHQCANLVPAVPLNLLGQPVGRPLSRGAPNHLVGSRTPLAPWLAGAEAWEQLSWHHSSPVPVLGGRPQCWERRALLGYSSLEGSSACRIPPALS